MGRRARGKASADSGPDSGDPSTSHKKLGHAPRPASGQPTGVLITTTGPAEEAQESHPTPVPRSRRGQHSKMRLLSVVILALFAVTECRAKLIDHVSEVPQCGVRRAPFRSFIPPTRLTCDPNSCNVYSSSFPNRSARWLRTTHAYAPTRCCLTTSRHVFPPAVTVSILSVSRLLRTPV